MFIAWNKRAGGVGKACVLLATVFVKYPLTCKFIDNEVFSLKMLRSRAARAVLSGGRAVDINCRTISTPSHRNGVRNVGMQCVDASECRARKATLLMVTGLVLVGEVDMCQRRGQRPACVNVDA